VVLYILVQVSVTLGVGFALFQNWTLRLESVKSNLVRDANMGNFLVESALTSVAKSLDKTQALFQQAMQAGPLDQKAASQMLVDSYASFQSYNKTEIFGLLFYADKNGVLSAQSRGRPEKIINVSDRRYFSQLREQPQKLRAVGPMVLSRTTGLWVFHLAVPLYDSDGAFDGVLVQQILANDIAAHLNLFVDTREFDQMFTHYDGLDPSFAYPPPGDSATADIPLFRAWSQRKTQEAAAEGVFSWQAGQAGLTDQMLVGGATSSTYALTTYASFPMGRLQRDFWIGNLFLIVYFALGVCFVTVIFWYGYKLSRRLAQAQSESLHDALTTLHNRRALDETLPYLIRQSRRTKAPISVLFVDIDHFRYFNEHFGHESGDIALAAVAHTLRACARRPLDFVCRWGGEEFVLVLPDTDRLAAQSMAERVLVAVRAIELQGFKGHHPKLTVSVGHVTAAMTPDSLQEDLIDGADKAMLIAKSSGRDQRAEHVLGAAAEANPA
jgi:diguanylate cyclase (GGDEF)-like protein